MQEYFPDKINACVIVPTYNNHKTLKRVLNGILSYTGNIIVVNDGSTDRTFEILKNYPQLAVLHQDRNKGKGLALRKGFKYAVEQGFDYAFTIDSDGQHFPEDIPVFVKNILEEGEALLIGARNMTEESVPKKSSFGNRFSNFWFWFETGIKLTDTQSGFRLYPLNRIKNLKFFTSKFEFEIEVIVKSAWQGTAVKNVPIQVLYDESERVSHFRPFKDFTRISFLNTYLVIIQFLYIIPRNYFRRYKSKGLKRFFFEDLLHSEDSDLKKSLSVSLGVFFGIMPFWGFQTWLTLFFAFALRLNKFIAFAFSNISIPPMIPFIVFGSIKIGGRIMNRPNKLSFDFDTFSDYKTFMKYSLIDYVIGSSVLAVSSAILLGLLSYSLLKFRKC